MEGSGCSLSRTDSWRPELETKVPIEVGFSWVKKVLRLGLEKIRVVFCFYFKIFNNFVDVTFELTCILHFRSNT